MKIFLLIILFASNLFATDYYVKNSGNDAADGTSDATAWKTIAKVQSLKLLPGDKILLKRGGIWRENLQVSYSGAVDNPIIISAYGEGHKPIISGADLFDNTQWNYVTPNYYSLNLPVGSGKPLILVVDDIVYKRVNNKSELSKYKFYVDQSSSPNKIYLFSDEPLNNEKIEISVRVDGIRLVKSRFIKISNIEFRYNSFNGIRGLNAQANSNVIIDSCDFFGNGQAGVTFYNHYNNAIIQNCIARYNGNGFYANIADSISFINNIADSNFNFQPPWTVTDGHGIGIYDSKDCLVEYCIITQNYTNTGIDPASDVCDAIFRYNIIGEPQGFSDNLLLGANTGATVRVYYNIIYGVQAIDAVATGGDVYIYNNTFYDLQLSGASQAGFLNDANYSVTNNIFYSIKSNDGCLVHNVSAINLTLDYNLYYHPNTNIVQVGATKYADLAAWQAASGQDANSVEGDPLFTNPTSDFSLQTGSPAINAGTDLGLTQDILNKPLTGMPDIGAFEHHFLMTKIKVFLEGAYKNGLMTTYLNSNNLISKKQPYNISPWNYAGTESVLSVPSSIVDWVLIELRTSTGSSSTVARRAALLKSDGTIVDLDGSSTVRFDFIPNGKYYIVVKHRNHLAIMSANSVSLSETSTLYDFTDSQSKAFGINPMIKLGDTFYGMYSGDGDSNGGVSSSDRNNVWRIENGKSGYLKGDFDLNGTVDSNDLDLHWSIENGNLTQVPE